MDEPRALDEPIPDDEELFRAIGPGDLVGGRLREEAIDLQGMSVHRAKYCDAHIPLIASRPSQRGIAATERRSLPGIQEIPPLAYRFFVVDAPSVADPHHAEIRVNTDPDSRKNKKRIKSKAASKQLKIVLARAFRVHTEP